MLNIRLPEKLERQLEEEARRSDRSRSEVARDALAFYLRIHRRRRYIERLKQAAALLAEAEARALADEALPLDNEALAVAEAPSEYADGDKWWA
jgi:metal-responsive CopG/Arc/MetJ family transcriptional regulator